MIIEAKILQNNCIYEVSQLVAQASFLLNQHFSVVWVSGEISNLSFPKSGHIYFSLKDHKSQVRCALFSRVYQKSELTLKEGAQVLIRANVSIYEARGDFQLIVQEIELAGIGKLRQIFEQLKAKLNQAGWFDPRHKKPLPRFPKCIGVITSATGAAICDVLAVLKRRFASIPVIIYPVLVQGELAVGQIVQALKRANQRLDCDVLILCRGGGSIEDLWAFNDELVARAIFDSELPIVAGIGHEIDFTIADFVADVRAPTPSGAAELVVPNALELVREIQQYKSRFIQIFYRKFEQLHQKMAYLKDRLQHPKEQLNRQRHELLTAKQRLLKIMQYSLAMEAQRLASLMRSLSTMAPINTLKRGYAIALKDNIVLTDPALVRPGDKIEIRLAEGNLSCVVMK